MDGRQEIANLVASKVANLYASGDANKIAAFEAATRRKAEERGESPEQAMSFLEMVKKAGAGLMDSGVTAGDDRFSAPSVPNVKERNTEPLPPM